MSVYSWAVIWNRTQLYARVERSDRAFLGAFRRLAKHSDFRLLCDQHPQSLLAKVALAGQKTLDQHPPEADPPCRGSRSRSRAMDRAAGEETARLERHVGFPGHHRQCFAFHRSDGHGVGRDDRLSQHRCPGLGIAGRRRAGHRGSADRHRGRSGGGDSRGGRLQPFAPEGCETSPNSTGQLRTSSSISASGVTHDRGSQPPPSGRRSTSLRWSTWCSCSSSSSWSRPRSCKAGSRVDLPKWRAAASTFTKA